MTSRQEQFIRRFLEQLIVRLVYDKQVPKKTRLTRNKHFIPKGDAGKFHPFLVLGFVLHLCERQPGHLKPAAPERVQTRDRGHEVLVLGAAADDQKHL